MALAFASAKASFLCGIGAGFATQNRARQGGESHKTRFERFIFQTYTSIPFIIIYYIIFPSTCKEDFYKNSILRDFFI